MNYKFCRKEQRISATSLTKKEKAMKTSLLIVGVLMIFMLPAGWHIATDAEWKTLENFLTADSAAGRLKEKGTMHWAFPNQGATNTTGFTALPGGYRDTDGPFSQSGYYAYFWTSSESSSVNGHDRFLGFNFAWMGGNFDGKTRGQTIRCIQDTQ